MGMERSETFIRYEEVESTGLGEEEAVFFFFFGRVVQLVGSQFPNQGLNPHHSSESPES